MNDDMDTTEETGVAVVGAAKRSAPVGPGARARGKARTVTTTRRQPGEDEDAARADVPVAEQSSPASSGASGAGDGAGARQLRHGGRTVPLWVAVVLGAVAVVTLVMALLFGSLWSNLDSQQRAANDAKAEAKSFLLALTNFRPNTVDSDFATLMGMATGDFAKQAQSFFGTNIRQALQTARAQSDGQIRSLYVQKVDGNQAVVYGVVDQTYANSKSAVPATDVLRVELSLTDTAQGWKIAEVSVLQAPVAAGTPSGNASSAVPGG
jgi:hypothetical protein